MTLPSVSVVVVSRHRPDLLQRCIVSLSQLIFPTFEIVVVADPEGLSRLKSFEARIKTVPFDAANISSARNVGIRASSGDVLAFIDDDAVPEPTWLAELVKGFEIEGVAAVGGFVRGRNGISYQWRAGAVDRLGNRKDISSSSDPFVPALHGDLVPKLEGTNMAVRRKVLLDQNGFDPAFRYYLDETDLCRRIADAGHRLAFSPGAEVHHGFAANPTRGVNRAPKTLFEIGASKAVFLRKHANSAELESGFASYTLMQRNRLLSFMIYGMIEPRDVDRLLDTLEKGFSDGLDRPIVEESLAQVETCFLPFETWAPVGSIALSGRTWQRGKLRREAADLRKRGNIVSVFLLEPSFRRHHVRFELPGIWIQSGGLWGRSDRAVAPALFRGFHARVSEEIRRTAPQRAIADEITWRFLRDLPQNRNNS